MKKLILAILLASCGVDNKSDLDIVGGQPVYRQYYGRLEVGGSFRCGATLIDKSWALSAEHCLRNPMDHSRVKIRFGAYASDGRNGGKPSDLVPVRNVFLHPDQDLVLLKLQRPSKFRPVSVSAGRHVKPGDKLQAFGWGQVKFEGNNRFARNLNGVVLRAAEGRNDNILYTKANPKGICFGDSGGPLIDPRRRELVGVTSWTGSRCGSEPGVDGFARPDMGWIRRYVRL